MKLETLKLALVALDDNYDITLNTDWSYESIHSKECLMIAGDCPEREKIVDAFLELQENIEMIEKEPYHIVDLPIRKIK